MITLFNLISQSVSGLTSFGRSRHSLPGTPALTAAAQEYKPSHLSSAYGLQGVHPDLQWMGSRHPRPGPHFRLPGPHTSRLGACHPRPLASSFQDRPPTQWSYDAVPLTSPGTAPAPTRLGSARPPNQQPAPAAAPSKSSPNGLLRHPLPEKANGYKVLVGPHAAGSRSSISYSAEFLSSPSCTRASTSPMTPPSRPTNATAETRFSLVALHAKDTHTN